MGHTLPTAGACSFLSLVVVVARRYELKLDELTKQCQSKTRCWFRAGVSLAGLQIHTLFPTVVHIGNLPSPLHHLFLSFSHMVSLPYGTKHMPPAVWATQGKIHVGLAEKTLSHFAVQNPKRRQKVFLGTPPRKRWIYSAEFLPVVCSCRAFCAIVSAFDVRSALLSTNLQGGGAMLQLHWCFSISCAMDAYYGKFSNRFIEKLGGLNHPKHLLVGACLCYGLQSQSPTDPHLCTCVGKDGNPRVQNTPGPFQW